MNCEKDCGILKVERLFCKIGKWKKLYDDLNNSMTFTTFKGMNEMKINEQSDQSDKSYEYRTQNTRNTDPCTHQK